MKKLLLCLVAMAAAVSAHAQTVAPGAPVLNVGTMIKGLTFNWEPVPGATWYQLEIKAHERAQWSQVADDFLAPITSTAYRFPLHLYFWSGARYRLAACNDAGCSRSEEVPVSDLRRYAVGYFKPAQVSSGQRFGADTDASGDGIGFVASAPGELIGGMSPGGAIYVFRRFGAPWRQRARLEPTIPPFVQGRNEMKVAINTDGTTVALGMPNYFHSQFDAQSGEVFVFRLEGTKFVRTRISAGSRGHFGRWIGLSDAGDILAIAHGEPGNPSLPPGVFIFKLVNGVWTGVRGIGNRSGRAEKCGLGVLSGDGTTVAESCEEPASGTRPARVYIRTHSGTNWTTRIDLPLEMSVASPNGYGHGGIAIDGTGNNIAAQVFVPGGPSEVQVFEREDGVYEKEATIRPGAWRNDTQRSSFGQSIALSGNGIVLAIGDAWDNGRGEGPRAAPLIAGASRTGAVYVYRYYDDWWNLYNMVKPNYHPDAAPYLTFGEDVEFDLTGKLLLLGESGESSNAAGIYGDWESLATPGSGAVWLY